MNQPKQLRKRIRDLEQEIYDNNIKIQEYQNILQKLDGSFDKKTKTKFTKHATNLLSEIKNKINSFNSLF